MFDDPPDTETSGYLPQASTEHAIAAGKRFGANFSSIIASKLGVLAPDKFGSQFFHPTSVAGLFPNLSATYVVAFLPEQEHEEEKNGGAAAAAAAAAAVYGGVSVSGAGGGSRGGQQRKAPPAKGMRLRGAVPSEESWRPFFGAMAVSYTTTETVNVFVALAQRVVPTRNAMFVSQRVREFFFKAFFFLPLLNCGTGFLMFQ